MAANELFYTTLYTDGSLQAYYRMEGGFTDNSPNAYGLTAVNSPTFGAGQFGNAAQFASASSQYAQRTAGNFANLVVSGDQTWMCWVKLTTNTATMEPFSIYDGGTGLIRFQLNSGANGNVSFQLLGLTTNNIVTHASQLSTGVWYHIAGVYNSSAGKLRVFIDGVKTEVNAGGTVTAPSGANFDMARLGNADSEYLNGSLDDFAMFSRALTDTEILNYVNGATPLRVMGGSYSYFM